MVPATVVTIVIPTFNDDPEHVLAAVASAKAQTHPSVEIVVVDDGSSRYETAAAVQALDDPGSVTVIRQINQGPAAARNTGIRAGTGGVIICLDADDILTPTYASECVEVLSSNASSAVAYPRMEPFGGPWRVWPTRGALRLGDFAQRSSVPVSAAFRRVDWQAVGGWDEDMHTGMEDHEWWVRLLGHTKGVALPLPTAALHHRARSGSRSRIRPYAEDLAVTRQRILENNPPAVLSAVLVGAWAATDTAEAEAARAWSDPWQLRHWGRAVRRRARWIAITVDAWGRRSRRR